MGGALHAPFPLVKETVQNILIFFFWSCKSAALYTIIQYIYELYIYIYNGGNEAEGLIICTLYSKCCILYSPENIIVRTDFSKNTKTDITHKG